MPNTNCGMCKYNYCKLCKRLAHPNKDCKEAVNYSDDQDVAIMHGILAYIATEDPTYLTTEIMKKITYGLCYFRCSKCPAVLGPEKVIIISHIASHLPPL